MLIRIETNAGHCGGMLTNKRIDLAADIWSFVMYRTGIVLRGYERSGIPGREEVFNYKKTSKRKRV